MKYASIVQDIYAAFGRGDFPAIIQHLHEDVEWEYGGTDKVPWLVPRRGHAGAMEFFKSLQALDFQHFNPHTVLENGQVVVGLIDLEFTVRDTGKKVTEVDEVHIWHFNEAGKVSRFRHRLDTLQTYEALQA